MDTSIEYATMCEKAFGLPGVGGGANQGNSNVTDTSVRSTLPRQDDLQGMVDWERYELYFWKGAKLWLLVELMTEDYETLENRRHLFSGDSMESLWLQFVMWEKYGTVWNAADQHWQPAKITAHVTL